MNGYYSIGELSQKTGLSIHTLRYYDSIGLLVPDHVDEGSGYRYYDAVSFWRCEVIKIFKSLDVPLEDLKTIIANKDNESIQAVLNEKKKETKRLIKKYRQVIKDIDWFEDMLDEMKEECTGEIYEITREAYPVIYTENQREERELHLTLMDISLNELQHTEALQRKYGYIVDERILQNNLFRRKGEFVNLYKTNYKHTEKENIYMIPGGRYVCQRIELKDYVADMSKMRKYLHENHLTPKFILAEEVGLPLFNFRKFDCELQILVE